MKRHSLCFGKKSLSNSQPDETEPSAPEPVLAHEDNLLPTIPQARTVLWNGQDTSPESDKSSPFYMDMSVAPEEQFTYDQPKVTSEKKPSNPYRIPFIVAMTLGIVLVILILIFLIVIGMITLA